MGSISMQNTSDKVIGVERTCDGLQIVAFNMYANTTQCVRFVSFLEIFPHQIAIFAHENGEQILKKLLHDISKNQIQKLWLLHDLFIINRLHTSTLHGHP